MVDFSLFFFFSFLEMFYCVPITLKVFTNMQKMYAGTEKPRCLKFALKIRSLRDKPRPFLQ